MTKEKWAAGGHINRSYRSKDINKHFNKHEWELWNMICILLERKWKEESQESKVLSQDLAPSSFLYQWLNGNRGLSEKQAGHEVAEKMAGRTSWKRQRYLTETQTWNLFLCLEINLGICITEVIALAMELMAFTLERCCGKNLKCNHVNSEKHCSFPIQIIVKRRHIQEETEVWELLCKTQWLSNFRQSRSAYIKANYHLKICEISGSFTKSFRISRTV